MNDIRLVIHVSSVLSWIIFISKVYRSNGNCRRRYHIMLRDGRRKQFTFTHTYSPMTKFHLFYIGSKTPFSKSDPRRCSGAPVSFPSNQSRPTTTANHSPRKQPITPPRKQPITAHHKFKIYAWPTLTPFFYILYANDDNGDGDGDDDDDQDSIIFSRHDPSFPPSSPTSPPGLDTSRIEVIINEWSRASSPELALSTPLSSLHFLRGSLSPSLFPSHS